MEGSFSPLHKADQNCHVLSGGANRRHAVPVCGHRSMAMKATKDFLELQPEHEVWSCGVHKANRV